MCESLLKYLKELVSSLSENSYPESLCVDIVQAMSDAPKYVVSRKSVNWGLPKLVNSIQFDRPIW